MMCGWGWYQHARRRVTPPQGGKPGPMGSRSAIALLVVTASILLALSPLSVDAGGSHSLSSVRIRAATHARPSKAAAAVASVFWIQKGLAVQPPKKKAGKGKKGQKLFNQY